MKYLEITEDKHKQSLDELNKHAKNGGESVVALTAPWCGHCKALKPELNKMRSKLKGGNGIVANVSDKYHSQLDMDTQVDGFPTIRHFKGGKKVRDYEGKRAAEELANFANNSLNSGIQAGGGKRKKTRRRKKRGAGGAVLSKPAYNGSSTKKLKKVIGGIEIGNNTSHNDIEYYTLYNTILARLENYSLSGLGTNTTKYEVTKNESIPRAIGELKTNRGDIRGTILDTATMISSYNINLLDNELLAIAFALYISLVGGEQYDDSSDIQRMLGLMAYGREKYDKSGIRGRFINREKSKRLMKIFLDIATKGERGAKPGTYIESKIRRKMMGLNKPHSNNKKSYAIRKAATASARRRQNKTNKGGRRKRQKHTKKKMKKKRRNTKKRGGGLCASRQVVCHDDMTAIKTHTFLPSKLRSTRAPAANSPSLVVNIGTDDICYKIGTGWLRENTEPMLAVALWLSALNENHNWIPDGRDPNGLFTAQAIKEKIDKMINKHRGDN